MTTAAISPWDTVLLIKNRALTRLEKKLAAQRQELQQCRYEVSCRNKAVSQCRDDSDRHALRLEALLQSATGFSPQQYLDYDAYRQVLEERIRLAVEDAAVAEQQLVSKQSEINVTNNQIGKTTTKRDLIKKKIEMQKNQKDQVEQNSQDEEAAEANLARYILAVKKADLQRMTR